MEGREKGWSPRRDESLISPGKPLSSPVFGRKILRLCLACFLVCIGFGVDSYMKEEKRFKKSFFHLVGSRSCTLLQSIYPHSLPLLEKNIY